MPSCWHSLNNTSLVFCVIFIDSEFNFLPQHRTKTLVSKPFHPWRQLLYWKHFDFSSVCLWGLFSLSGGVLLLNRLCLFFFPVCLNCVILYIRRPWNVWITHRPPFVFLELNGGLFSHQISGLVMFLLHCDVLHSVGSALIMSKYDACGGRVDETDSCHYLSVHICMFVNPAETKIKLLQLLWRVLFCWLQF